MLKFRRYLLLFFWLPVMAAAAEWTTFTAQNSGLPDNTVKAICVDGYGRLWFGTNNGLALFDGSTWRSFKTASTNSLLAANAINDLVYQNSPSGKQLWVATMNGVSMLDISAKNDIVFSIPYRTNNSSLVSNTVNALAVDPGHIRWFGTDLGANSFTGSAWGVYTVQNWWLDTNMIKSMAAGPDSMIYLGTEGTGVSRLKMDPVDGITSASVIDWTWSGLEDPEGDKLVSDSVYSILIEADGRQWFGTDHGVCMHTGNNTKRDWTTYTTDDGLAHNFVQAIARDKSGNMWFGTKAGVSRFDGAAWQTFTTANGLAGNEVFDIAVSANGAVWFCTNAGVSRFLAEGAAVAETPQQTPAEVGINSYPNPFNMSTTVVFDLPNTGNANISIYNISGQKVRSLIDGLYSPGHYSITWDGRTDRGLPAQSGIYFVTLTSAGFSATWKVILAK